MSHILAQIAPPAPVPASPDAPATDTPSGTPGIPTDGALGVIWDLKWVIVGIAVWIGILYGWKRLRQRNAQKGKATPPLGMIIRPLLKFMFREDKRPIFSKPQKFAAKMKWLTGSRLYLLLMALIPASKYTGFMPWPVVAFVLLMFVWGRYAPIAKARRGVLMQMFAVAASECKYPRGSEMNPWGYINIQRWVNLVQPGDTIVTYPAAYQSEDLRTRQKFEQQFNGTISDENTWNYKWESSKNRVTCRPTDFLPKMASYPGPSNEWNMFHLGIGAEGPVGWDVSTFPHALIAGPTGTGKSVLQRMILFHALTHSDTWKIVGVDPKRVELGWLRKYDNVLKIALDLEEGVEVVNSVRDEMMRRYDEMEGMGYNHFQKMPSPPPAILIMIDETYMFLAPENIKSDEGKERDALHARATVLLGEIARLGRAAGIHLVMATQRPDAKVIPGELKANCDMRLAAGRMDTTPSMMVLDDEGATRLPKIKGRGLIRLGGELQEYQGYFAEQDWFDKWVEQQKAAADGPAMIESAPSVDVPAPSDSGKEGRRGKGGLKARAEAMRAKAEAREAEGAVAAPAAQEEPALVLPESEKAVAAPSAGVPDSPAVTSYGSADDQVAALLAAHQATAVTVPSGPADFSSPDDQDDLGDPYDSEDLEDLEESDDDGWDEEEVAAAAAAVTAVPAVPAPVAPAPAVPSGPAPKLPVLPSLLPGGRSAKAPAPAVAPAPAPAPAPAAVPVPEAAAPAPVAKMPVLPSLRPTATVTPPVVAVPAAEASVAPVAVTPAARPAPPVGAQPTGGLPSAPRPGMTGGLPFVAPKPIPARPVPSAAAAPPVPAPAPAKPAPPAAPAPAPASVDDDPFAPPGGIAPSRPKPVTAPPAARPGAGLPNPLGRPGPTAAKPTPAPAPAKPQAAPGLPVSRPGLPTRPPTAG